MIYKNRECTPGACTQDVFVDGSDDVIWMVQARPDHDTEMDIIQITSAADAEKLIEIIRGLIAGTFRSQSSEVAT
jgi:hypothetical protein